MYKIYLNVTKVKKNINVTLSIPQLGLQFKSKIIIYFLDVYYNNYFMKITYK